MTKSKIFLYLCLSFVVGIFIRSLIKIPLPTLGGIFVLGVILIGVFWGKNKKISVAGFCLLFLIFGSFCYLQKEKVGDLEYLNSKGRLSVVGKIIDLPDRREFSQKLKIKAEKVIIMGKEIKSSGLLLATTKIYPEYQYGDLLEITGQLKEPENFSSPTGEFDYKSYLAKSGIYSVVDYPEIKLLAENQGSGLKKFLFWLKQKFERSLEQVLPEPQASFLAGLTLGEQKQIPEELSLAFQETGTTHIVALSGYNITLIASFFMSIFGFFMLRKSWSFWLAVLGIIFFTILTGASASVTRAAIMGILVLLARQSGRLYSVRNALVFAGAVMVYLNPKILRFDIGFQLSFLATAGLIWLTPIFEKWLQKLPRLFSLKEIFICTLSAQLAVLPLLLVYFGRLSLISPLVNLIILLFIPQTMLFGFLAGGIGMFWLAAAKIFGWLVWLFLTFEIAVIKIFASLPLASVKIQWGWGLAVFYYLIIVCLIYPFYYKQKDKILVEQWAKDEKESFGYIAWRPSWSDNNM